MDNYPVLQSNDNMLQLAEQMPTELLQQMLTVRLSKSVEAVQKDVCEVRDAVLILKDNHGRQLDDLNNSVMMISNQFNRIDDQHLRGRYKTASELGRLFRFNITPQRMNRLLKVVGILLSSVKEPTPSADMYKGKVQMCYKLDKKSPKGKVVGWYPIYHEEKAIKHINEWLHKRDYLLKFNTRCNEAELETFIDELYYTHVTKQSVQSLGI